MSIFLSSFRRKPESRKCCRNIKRIVASAACAKQAGMPKLPENDNDSTAEYLPLMAPRDGLEPPT